MSYFQAAANVVNAASPYIGLASSAYGAYNTYREGRAIDASARIEAKAVEDQARDDEIQRKRALIASLSAQSAAAGARGMTTGGSFSAMQGADIRQAQNDLLNSKVTATARMQALRQKGRAMKNAAKAKAGFGLFGAAGDFAENYNPGAVSKAWGDFTSTVRGS